MHMLSAESSISSITSGLVSSLAARYGMTAYLVSSLPLRTTLVKWGASRGCNFTVVLQGPVQSVDVYASVVGKETPNGASFRRRGVYTGGYD